MDNTGQSPYSGADLDPTPGVFKVKTVGSNSVLVGKRYRIQQKSAPIGYQFTTPSSWNEIEGQTGWLSDRNVAASGEWVDGVHDFGSIAVTKKATTLPVCEAGHVYGILSTGQIRQVNPDGPVVNMGSPAPGSNRDFNGLGIGTGGSPVFAYNRSGDGSDSRPMIYKYDTTTGTWSSTNTRIPSENSSGVTFVAGAVNLKTGTYFLGGYAGSGSGRVFRLWEFDPQSSSLTYRGSVAAPGDGEANGDIAFDSQGTLFIVRGSDNTTTVYSVTADSLATANGGTIPSSPSSSVSGTTSKVNGAAFDADGNGFLSNGSDANKYEMPGWASGVSVTTALEGSNDLASCGSPPTITIQKILTGRANSSDQFTMTLKRGSTLLGSATTTGSSLGVQKEIVGPQATGRNRELTFVETGSGSTTLSDYATTWSCTVDGDPMPGSTGAGTTGTVTIPPTGQAVVCTFTNSPLRATINVTKTLLDRNGVDPQPGKDWRLQAKLVKGQGAALVGNENQSADANGKSTWTVKFDNATSVADIAVSEGQRDGYLFDSGQCQVIDANGTLNEPIDISSADGATVPDVTAGQTVNCEFTNRENLAALTLIKKVENDHGGTAKAEQFELAATPEGAASPIKFSTGVKQDIAPGSYVIGETQLLGYEQTNLSCAAGGTALDVVGSTVHIANAQDVVCTITNADLPGSVAWSKVSDGGDPLNGSTWSLVGPEGDGSKTVSVEDCVQDNPTACTGLDKDPKGGSFKVENLSWGDYTLTETKAPAGYVIDNTEHKFQISADSRDYVFGKPFVNTQATPPSLPLTGGLGTDTFLLVGGGLLALAGFGGWIHRRRSQRLRMA